MKKIQDIREKRTEDRSPKSEAGKRLPGTYMLAARISKPETECSEFSKQISRVSQTLKCEEIANGWVKCASGARQMRLSEKLTYVVILLTLEERYVTAESYERSSAPMGRQVTAQGKTLCLNGHTSPIAPSNAIVQCDEFAWGKKENIEYRSLRKSEVRSRKMEVGKKSQSHLAENALKSLSQPAPRNRGFVGRQDISARGTVSDHWRNALGLNVNMNFIASRLNIAQGDKFAWGKKENVEYRMMNNEYRSEEKKLEDRRRKTEESRSFYFSAPTGRQAIAQGEALCNNAPTTPIAPRLNIAQGDTVIWGNNNNTLLADRNRLAHSNNKYRNKEEKPGLRLSKVEETLSDLGKSDSQKNDNSICQRTDEKFSKTIFIYNSTIIMEFFSFSLRQLTEDRREASYNIYLN